MVFMSKNTSHETILFKRERELNNLIEACHRTIDWSIALYFKPVKKGVRLYSDKASENKKNDFYFIFKSFILNDIDLCQMVKELEYHINNDVLVSENKNAPTIKFRHFNCFPSFDFINEIINEQKTTTKLCQHAEKTINQLACKSLPKIVPPFIPGILASKAGPSLGKKICSTLAVDRDSNNKKSCEIIEKQLTGLLENMEHGIKEHLKYQLAEQLYHWYDKNMQGPEHSCNEAVNH